MLIPHKPSRHLHRAGADRSDLDDVTVIEVPYNEAAHQPATAAPSGRTARINARPPE